MTAELRLEGPTVTLFGDHDILDRALSDELGRRGCSTHTISIPMGWLDSISHSVIRIDTVAGQDALEGLASRHEPPANVVVVGETPVDDSDAERIDELCRRCGERHDVSLIWYPPLDRAADGETLPSDDLAAAIADEIGHQEAWTGAPSFASRVFTPRRHRGHA